MGFGLPASTQQGGTALGVPDVCKTPMPPPVGTVPVPYPNTGQVMLSTDTVTKVLIDHMPVVVETSSIPLSNGDEAGVTGGVNSGSNLGKVAYRLYSARVIADGKKVVYATCVTAHNGVNANLPAGLQAVPSQLKVLVSP